MVSLLFVIQVIGAAMPDQSGLEPISADALLLAQDRCAGGPSAIVPTDSIDEVDVDSVSTSTLGETVFDSIVVLSQYELHGILYFAIRSVDGSYHRTSLTNEITLHRGAHNLEVPISELQQFVMECPSCRFEFQLSSSVSPNIPNLYCSGTYVNTQISFQNLGGQIGSGADQSGNQNSKSFLHFDQGSNAEPKGFFSAFASNAGCNNVIGPIASSRMPRLSLDAILGFFITVILVFRRSKNQCEQ